MPSKQLADLTRRVEALEKAVIGIATGFDKPTDDLKDLIKKCRFNYVNKNITALDPDRPERVAYLDVDGGSRGSACSGSAMPGMGAAASSS